MPLVTRHRPPRFHFSLRVAPATPRSVQNSRFPNPGKGYYIQHLSARTLCTLGVAYNSVRGIAQT